MIYNLPSQNAFKSKYGNGGISGSPGLKPTSVLWHLNVTQSGEALLVFIN